MGELGNWAIGQFVGVYGRYPPHYHIEKNGRWGTAVLLSFSLCDCKLSKGAHFRRVKG